MLTNPITWGQAHETSSIVLQAPHSFRILGVWGIPPWERLAVLPQQHPYMLGQTTQPCWPLGGLEGLQDGSHTSSCGTRCCLGVLVLALTRLLQTRQDPQLVLHGSMV